MIKTTMRGTSAAQRQACIVIVTRRHKLGDEVDGRFIVNSPLECGAGGGGGERENAENKKVGESSGRELNQRLEPPRSDSESCIIRQLWQKYH
jgi:hypothetical protein